MRGFGVTATVAVAVIGIGLGVLPVPASATLHGYCAGTLQCVDNGTNSPTTNNPPQNFGFTTSPGPTTGVSLSVDFLIPNNAPGASSLGPIAITGTFAGSATLFSATPWTGAGSPPQTLAGYLGIGASPNNPIGAYLPSTQALDPGATGFFVYQATFSPAGGVTLQSPSNPNVSPLENIAISLPQGSYIVGFFNEGTAAAPNFQATANSGAIFESGPPRVPEPTTLLLIGTGLVAIGAGAWRRRQR